MSDSIPISQQRLKVIVAGICSLILCVGIARFAYTPFLPIMLEQTELTSYSGGWLATFNYIGYLIGVLWIAAINDLSLKYRLYKSFLILAVLTTIGMGLTTQLWLWSLLRLISGVTSTAGIILAAGFVMSWLHRHGFKTMLGLHFSGLGMGIALPGIFIAIINNYLDWAGQWLLIGLLGIVFLLPAWLWMPPPAKQHTTDSQTVAPPSTIWMRLMISAYFCAGVGYVVSATFIVAILEAMPALQGLGDWIWVLLGIAAIPSCLIWDRIAENIGENLTLICSYLTLILSIVIPAVSGTFVLNLIGALLFGFTFAGIVSMMLRYIGHKFPHNPAKAMAKLTISYGIAQIISPTLVGYIVTVSHSYTLALWGAAIIVLSGVLCLLYISKLEQKTVAIN